MIEPEAEIRHGTKIGRFVVVGQLGRGGMGVVYQAHDDQLDRQVALKVMRSAAATDEERMRMLREGQAVARTTHPNVITVYEVGVEGGLVFLAQELLDGGTLGEWLERPRSQDEILDKFIAAGRGLAAAHAAGLVHRDFKPHNVLLGKDGRVRVADFGLARAIGPEGDDLPAATRANMARAQLEVAASPMSPLTRTGAVMGTPMFMAPEQHEGQAADARSDQFAFSVALYHALYGDWPFAGKTAIALADAVIEGRLQKPPSDHRVPARLREILLRGLSTKREQRYPSMNAMLAELARPPGRPLRKLAIALVAAALVAGAVIGGYALRTHDEKREPGPVAFDPKTLTTGQDVQWLSTAIERGQLDDAADKYTMAAALAQTAGEQERASIAHSLGALVLVLRGKLDDARKHIHDADVAKGSDPTAAAYFDMASAELAFASGALDDAIARSTRCAKAFATTSPELAQTCDEIHGDAAAQRGDLAGARIAYLEGLAISKHSGELRTLTLRLAVAALELDDDKYDDAVKAATSLQSEAASLDAIGPEAQAWTLLARAHLAQASTQKALEDLDHVKLDKIEPFRVAIEQRIAHGEVLALLDQRDDGLKEIDDARALADQRGFPGLALAARLARVEVLTALSAPEVAAEQDALIEDAQRLGHGRIAHLAKTVGQR